MMMKEREHGFVLIAALLILLVLTLTGIAVNKNTTTESQIARNDRLRKETFYAADAATELIAEIVEQAFLCKNDGSSSKFLTQQDMILKGATDYDLGMVKSSDDGFWFTPTELVTIPSDSDRDFVFPAAADSSGNAVEPTKTNSQPHANINLGGTVEQIEGSTIIQAAGYEGLGKSLGSDGSSTLWSIRVQQVGKEGSQSIISAWYRHVERTGGFGVLDPSFKCRY